MESKSALLVIDMQKGFVTEYNKYLVEKIAGLVKQKKFDNVFFLKEINNENTNFYKILNWKKMMTKEETEYVDKLKEFMTEENTFIKNTYSAFKNQKLLERLKKDKITDIYLAGNDTESCILGTAIEGFDLGFRMHVLKDFVDTHREKYKEQHEIALDILRKNIGLVE